MTECIPDTPPLTSIYSSLSTPGLNYPDYRNILLFLYGLTREVLHSCVVFLSVDVQSFLWEYSLTGTTVELEIEGSDILTLFL